MLSRDVLNSYQLLRWVRIPGREDLEPSKHSPHAILFPDVIATCAERLLAAQEWRVCWFAGEVLLVTRIHEVPEEFPSSGRLKTRNTYAEDALFTSVAGEYRAYKHPFPTQ